MTPEELRAFAKYVLQEHTTTIEYTTIFKMAEAFNEEGAGITEEDAKKVAELIGKATVIITFDGEIEEAITNTLEEWSSTTGPDTPGCTCGHEDMGVSWHADVCPWAAREWQRQARALAGTVAGL